MAITLSKGNGETVNINSNAFQKGTLALEQTSVAGYYNIRIIRDNVTMFEDVLFSGFEDGDNGDAAFSSITALEEWWDANGKVYRDYFTPFRLVAAASTNDTLVKAGKTQVQNVEVINETESKMYLKVYDLATVPTSGDTPIITALIPPQSEDKPIRVATNFATFYGLGIRITALIDDADEGVVAAGDAIVNIMYR